VKLTGESRECTKDISGAGIDGVDLPSIDIERNSPERRPASTIARQPCACATWTSSRTSESAPVEVSAWTNPRNGHPDSSSISVRPCRGQPAPPLPSSKTGIPPQRSTFSFILPEDSVLADDDLVAGSRRFTKQVSIPADPGRRPPSSFRFSSGTHAGKFLDLIHHADELRIHMADRRACIACKTRGGHRRVRAPSRSSSGEERVYRHHAPPRGFTFGFPQMPDHIQSVRIRQAVAGPDGSGHLTQRIGI